MFKAAQISQTFLWTLRKFWQEGVLECSTPSWPQALQPKGLLTCGTGFSGCPERGLQASLESASLLRFSLPKSRILPLEKQLQVVVTVVVFLLQT